MTLIFFLMNKKIVLITGASGFLGTWLATELVKSGYSIIGIDIQVPQQPQLFMDFATASCETVDFEKLLDESKVFAVCHLAGGSSVGSSVINPFSDFTSLLPGTVRLALYLANNQPAARLFLFSSAAVYGNPSNLPVTEKTPISPISPYGAHKALTETLLTHYARIFNLQITILRIFSVYGSGLRKQLLWDVSQRAISAMQNGEKSIVLSGSGFESRDFIYASDVCRAVILLMERSSRNSIETYNLSSGIESTVRDVAVRLLHHLQVDITINFNNVVPQGDPTNWNADISKLQECGFLPQVSLDVGLEQVANWIKNIK